MTAYGLIQIPQGFEASSGYPPVQNRKLRCLWHTSGVCLRIADLPSSTIEHLWRFQRPVRTIAWAYPFAPSINAFPALSLVPMSAILSDLLGTGGWVWLMIPLLCLLLVHFGDQNGKPYETAVRLAGGTLVILVVIAMSPW